MNVKQLREALTGFPDDMEVMSYRGEWGPSRIKDVVQEHVFDSGGTSENWVNFYPTLEDESETRPTIQVVLID